MRLPVREGDNGNENENFRALQGGVGRDWDDEPLIQVLVTRKKDIFIWESNGVDMVIANLVKLRF